MRYLTYLSLAFALMYTNIASADIPKHMKELTLENLRVVADNTLRIDVTVIDETAKKPYTWQMTPADVAIFYDLLENLQNKLVKETNLNISDPESTYAGLSIQITNKYGEKIEPIIVYKHHVTYAYGERISDDPNRDLEYTIWGMNYRFANQDLMWKMLPIISFDDCVKLGNRLVSTSPRQCLLTNGDIFLEVGEKPSQKSLSIMNFEDCLTDGQAIINTFPRRCIASGGHVYTEAPKIR